LEFPELRAVRDAAERVVTRFAPAPTGHLHIGHVVNALYVWGVARQHGGQVLLRLEDHDRQRCRPEFEYSILDDLSWLGFVPDGPMVRQSDRGGIYRASLQVLREQGLVYACECSRREIAEGTEVGRELRYPGTCASKKLDEREGLGIRVRLPWSIECFDDALMGPQQQVPAEQCGDLLLRDRHGQWTYQFAVTVDDLHQGVDMVIRGADLLESTGRQILLARMLGRTDPPRFMHHALIMKSVGQKLSKSDRDTGIRDLRAAGMSREEVLAMARRLAGL
jgi:glutamyl/glutaminyl-tRNA synthetase